VAISLKLDPHPALRCYLDQFHAAAMLTEPRFHFLDCPAPPRLEVELDGEHGSGVTGTLNSLKLVGPLADNGGPTFTHALLLGSADAAPALGTYGVAVTHLAEHPRLGSFAPDAWAAAARCWDRTANPSASSFVICGKRSCKFSAVAPIVTAEVSISRSATGWVPTMPMMPHMFSDRPCLCAATSAILPLAASSV